MSRLVDALLSVPSWLALVLVVALPAAEASLFIGVIFPGEVAVLAGGVLAHDHRLPLWAVIAAGSAGAILGDSVGYEVGRRHGDRLLAKLPTRLVRPEHVDRGRDLLRRRGGWAIVLGRFTAALRALVPGLAGTSRIPYRTFLLFNVVGAVAWVTETALVGYLVGAGYRSAEHRLSLISAGLLAVIVAMLAYRAARRSERLTGWTRRRLRQVPRLDRRRTATLLTLAGSGWLFAGITQDVQAHEGIAAADTRLLHDVTSHRGPWLTPLATAVTDLALGPVVYALLAVLGLAVWRRTRRWELPVGTVALLPAGQLTRLAINRWIARPRPAPALWLTHPHGHAYPSGHTTTATLGYGLAALLLLRLLPTDKTTTAIVTTAATVLTAAVGLSRIYLGVHWPSDVVAGWALGLTFLALAATLSHLPRRRPASTPPLPSPGEASAEQRHAGAIEAA